MTESRIFEPFDEHTLSTLFNDVEAPAGLEANWRNRIAAATPAKGRRAARRFRFDARLRQAGRPWLRILAAGIAVTATGSVVGVVAANRTPAPAPDPDRIVTITTSPTTGLSVSPTEQPPPAPLTETASKAQAGPNGLAPGPNTGTVDPAPGLRPTPAPARGPLTDWPDASNTGIPPSTPLTFSGSDLHLNTPGQIVTDRQVFGAIYVEAPNVTLRRVQANGIVWQRPKATNLRIEDSEITTPQFGQLGIRQEAAGLVVQRSYIHNVAYAVAITSDVTIVDTFMPGTGTQVLTNGNTTRLTMRHNTIGGAVEISDQAGPVTDVTIDGNQLQFIWAPSSGASHDIRVTGNQFHHIQPDDTAVQGWNAQAPGNTWTGNVWFGTTQPANP